MSQIYKLTAVIPQCHLRPEQALAARVLRRLGFSAGEIIADLSDFVIVHLALFACQVILSRQPLPLEIEAVIPIKRTDGKVFLLGKNRWLARFS